MASASVAPVWILLQPREYLSAFLLYAMLAVALIDVIGVHPDIDSELFPAFAGFAMDNGNGMQYMFLILFTTVACGAISGFRSLVSSGTTSKQLDKEKDAKPIVYGGLHNGCIGDGTDFQSCSSRYTDTRFWMMAAASAALFRPLK